MATTEEVGKTGSGFGGKVKGTKGSIFDALSAVLLPGGGARAQARTVGRRAAANRTTSSTSPASTGYVNFGGGTDPGLSSLSGGYGALDRFGPVPQVGPAPQVGIPGDFGAAARAAFPGAIAAIEDKFRRAQEELSRREAVGGQVLGQMPGRINQQFAQGQQSMAGFAQPLVAAANAAIPASATPLDATAAAGAAPFAQAMGAMEQNRLADVPLLQAGMGQLIGGQRSALDMARNEALQQIMMQQAEMEARMSESRARMAQDAALANAKMQLDRDLANAGFSADARRDEFQFGAKANEPTGGLDAIANRGYAMSPARQTEILSNAGNKKAFDKMQADLQAGITAGLSLVEAIESAVGPFLTSKPETSALFLARQQLSPNLQQAALPTGALTSLMAPQTGQTAQR